ncbi:MAG: UDP-N-acetylmuramate dehydrogenase [Holosporales bacterium]|jgi:UDP-N-acetylmuramate dehydrogenase|nr:UDP-N-acetylmuramate dehydrogenase [Holosporales bacterium]
MNNSSKGDIFQNFALKDLSSFKIGGRCKLFFSPYNPDDLRDFLKNQSGNIPTICLGHMSNVLISDEDIEANIICTRDTFQDIRFFENNNVKVESGVPLNKFVHVCSLQGISCLEQMYCIPGTIGGALFMNAGTPIFEIFDVVVSIECVDMRGNIISINRDELKPAYRSGNIPKDLIITSCILRTSESSVATVQKTMDEIGRKRLSTQPISMATCGSTFKNPDGYKAWQLIDSAGCRGMSVGEAYVSDLHCNFIINNGNATFQDVKTLMRLIKEKVLEKHGIMLKEEIQIIEFGD